ncbi:MAG TPA: CaiB/BaiF CoA-transferase family protein [Allosphingosinicella sp.]|jgi:crotonobetainyl-CoA:carnitine CoA-transferase CaiB-like acyl-CoA transferase
MSGPLAGIRVLDFSKFLPGPYCTWLLAELGADVIRIENPRELAKQAKVFGWDRPGAPTWDEIRSRDLFARGKRSLALDFGRPGAAEAIEALAARADVLVEDYRPGVMASMGFGPEAMAAVNSRLIYCSVSLCGQTGPYASKPGHDPVALAIAGALSRIGEDKERPVFPGVPVADLMTGSNAVIAILAALLGRGSDGGGQHLDIAMSDSAMPLVGGILARAEDPANLPPRGMHRADSGIWRTADGELIVTTDMEPRYWQRFCQAIGLDDLAGRQMDRTAWPEMKARIAAAMETRTRAEWMAIFAAADTQYAPILEPVEALDDPHNRARGMVREMDGPGGTLRQIGCPVAREDPVTGPASRPGGESRAILTEIGFDEARIARLLEKEQ